MMEMDDRILLNMTINHMAEKYLKEGKEATRDTFEKDVIERYYLYKGIHLEMQKLSYKKR